MMSDHAEFRPFLADMGYPASIAASKRARDLALEKQRVMSAQAERMRQAILAEPLRARETRKFKVLEELERGGRALHAVVMNNLLPDLELTRRREGEPVTEWIQRLKDPDVAKHRLTPGEAMALGVALKHADELMRKAAGLEEFNWEDEELKAKALSKAGKLEFEIIKTSGAKALDQLPIAPEELAARKKVTA